jgi:hypothetical protein
MQWLLNLLNVDFLSGAASPTADHLSDAQQETVKQWIAKDLAEGKITQEQAKAYVSPHDGPPAVIDAAERGEAERLQARIVHHLTPILGLDPHELVELRRKTLRLLLRQAERRGNSKEARALRQQLAQEPHRREATRRRDREEGLRAIVRWLSEWAQGEQLYPWWQIDAPPPDEVSRAPADQHYRIGAKVFTVTQWPGRPNTLTAKGMMNLGACLVSGELNRLRVCIHEACGRYFYAEDLRSEHCSTACRRHKDRPRVVGRMRRMRKKQEAAAKALFLSTIPTLRVAQFRALEDQRTLDKRALTMLDDLVKRFPSLDTEELHRLGGMVKQFEDGCSFHYLWKQNHVRRLFKKLQRAPTAEG